MASRSRINPMAEDLRKAYGALISVSDIKEYLGCGKNYAAAVVNDLIPIGSNTGKRYFYQEVAEAVFDGQGIGASQ